MVYLGIDPGNTGAIAFIFPDDEKVEIYDFTDKVWLSKLRDIFTAGQYKDYKAVIEKVNAMPKQGVSSVFKFGSAFGYPQGVLDAYFVSYELITPQKWQSLVFDTQPVKPKLPVNASEKEKMRFNNAWKAKRKALSLDRARRLYPVAGDKYLARKKDNNRADALLIAHYCRLSHEKPVKSVDPLKALYGL